MPDGLRDLTSTSAQSTRKEAGDSKQSAEQAVIVRSNPRILTLDRIVHYSKSGRRTSLQGPIPTD
jgi:hypothetical protein